jgi:hypothetical protein
MSTMAEIETDDDGTEDVMGLERASAVQWVRVADLRVSDEAQRSFDPGQAEQIAAEFDPDAMGYPVVNHRDGAYWIVDGQHRVAALNLLGWDQDQSIECEVYEGLSVADEAELFLRRDKRRAINAFEKFRIGVVAERPTEVKINDIVEAVGLHASRQRGSGNILAVKALRRVYDLGGEEVLAQTLVVLRDTFGDPGYGASYLVGLGLVLNRYGSRLDLAHLKDRLLGLRGGPIQLNNKARQIQAQTGLGISLCYAAAYVEIYNGGGRGGKRVTPFFKAERVADEVAEYIEGSER